MLPVDKRKLNLIKTNLKKKMKSKKLPIYSKTLVEKRHLRDEISDGVAESFLRRVVGRGLHAQYEFVLEWMRTFVAGEYDLRIAQELT